jgi:hypothetical protein
MASSAGTGREVTHNSLELIGVVGEDIAIRMEGIGLAMQPFHALNGSHETIFSSDTPGQDTEIDRETEKGEREAERERERQREMESERHRERERESLTSCLEND